MRSGILRMQIAIPCFFFLLCSPLLLPSKTSNKSLLSLCIFTPYPLLLDPSNSDQGLSTRSNCSSPVAQHIARMNHHPTVEGRHDDDAALSDFLASLMDYTPTIPDELVEHYVAKSGFQCPDVRLIRLVAVATQKFVSEVASDALQHCKARQSTIVKDKRDKQQKDKRLIMSMEDLSKALHEYGVNVKHQEYFADNPSTGADPVSREE